MQPQAVAPVPTPPAKHVVPTAPPVHKPVEGPVSAPVVRTPQQPASQPTIQQPTATGNEPRPVATPQTHPTKPGNEHLPVPSATPASVKPATKSVSQQAPAATPIPAKNDAKVADKVNQAAAKGCGARGPIAQANNPDTCRYQGDFFYGQPIGELGSDKGSGPYYGSRLIKGTAGGHGACGSQTPPPAPKPTPLPVVKPPIDNVPPPVVEITCTTDSHRVGEECVPNEAPKPVTQPIQTPIQQVTAHESQFRQPQTGVPPQPQRIVNRLTVNNSHAVAATRPESAVPSAPVTGRGPATNELADTGAGPNPWLLVGLFIVLIGLLTLRVLDKLDRKSVEREVPR